MGGETENWGTDRVTSRRAAHDLFKAVYFLDFPKYDLIDKKGTIYFAKSEGSLRVAQIQAIASREREFEMTYLFEADEV